MMLSPVLEMVDQVEEMKAKYSKCNNMNCGKGEMKDVSTKLDIDMNHLRLACNKCGFQFGTNRKRKVI